MGNNRYYTDEKDKCKPEKQVFRCICEIYQINLKDSSQPKCKITKTKLILESQISFK
jgi:hypothetical protein